MIRHAIMHTYRTKWRHGMVRERDGDRQVAYCSPASARPRAGSLPPSLRWLRGDAREGADLSSLFYLFIYNLPSFL